MRGMLHKNSGIGEVVRRLARHHYVERQIYLRSHGQVQFVSLSPFTQAVFAAIAFVFFGWVAFASVNVVFKQQIIASKDQRYLKTQGAYEERLAQLQTAYDRLNGQLIISQERFLATTRTLEEKHRQLAQLLSRRQSASSELDTLRSRHAATLRSEGARSQSNTILIPVGQESRGVDIGRTTTRPPHATDAETFVVDGAESGSFDIAGLAGAHDVHNGTVSQIDARLTKLDRAQQGLINSVEETTDRKIRELKAIIGMTEVIDVKTLTKRAGTRTGEGGPFIGLAEGEMLAGAGNDRAFSKQLFRIGRSLDAMADLERSIAGMPLAAPLANYRETSSFGPRVDPFNGKMAFHAGVDLASDYGAPVHATAPGIVVFAGWKGAYGRMIEIDVGDGFRTRYGHLSRIDVDVGQKIAFGDVVGKVGSSGRSSGPHVHYEVWFDGIVRDPSKFIEAGHYVFAKEG